MARVWNAMLGQYMDDETGNPWAENTGPNGQIGPKSLDPVPKYPLANYTTQDPFIGMNGVSFNYGSPGSPTAAINSQNRGGDPNKPYVDQGDTGGYLWQKGVTIGEGKSTTPAENEAFKAQARAAGYSDAEIADYERRNPGDMHRFLEGMGNTPGGGGGSSSVANRWLQTGSSSGTPSAADAFYQQLLARSQQSLNVNPNDPIIRGQTDAFGAAQERSRREYLNDLAEKQGPVQNLTGEARLTADRAGQNTAAFQAQVIGRELTARRDEIAQALTLMAGRLTTEQTLALQRELGMIDAHLRELAITTQASQFQDTLALNAWDLTNRDDRIRLGYSS